MSENPKFTRKTMLLLMGGVLIAAFLGVFAGTSFTEWNSVQKRKAQIRDKISLRVGQAFPQGSFLDLDGKSYNLGKDLEGKKTILFFITTGCPHCEELLDWWVESAPSLGSNYQVAAVSFEPVDKLRRYKEERNLSFPVFNDSIGRFTGAYKIEVYPTIIGVNEQKKVVFIEVGNNPKKSVEDYFRGL